MRHWNHRILFDGTQYWVGEVYYDDRGWPHGFTGPQSCPLSGWETLDELVKTIRYVQEAITKPVVDIGDGNTISRDGFRFSN